MTEHVVRIGLNPRLGVVMYCEEAECKMGDDYSTVYHVVTRHDDLRSLMDRATLHVRGGHHAWQEYNTHGNTCHYPGCQLSEEEHKAQG